MFNKKFIKKLLILASIAAILFLALFVFPDDAVVLKIDNTKVIVELADTQEERAKGLSGKENLGRQEGILFIFEKPDFHGIWMKDMNFAIDILWIDEDYKVVDIKTNAKPESYPEVFLPKTLSKYVLEVNTGFVEDNNIEIGDKIKF